MGWGTSVIRRTAPELAEDRRLSPELRLGPRQRRLGSGLEPRLLGDAAVVEVEPGMGSVAADLG
jgi:hypothetical protein